MKFALLPKYINTENFGADWEWQKFNWVGLGKELKARL